MPPSTPGATSAARWGKTMPHIQNADDLTNHGDARLRRMALDIIEHALAAADPYHAAMRLIHLEGETLHIGALALDLRRFERVLVIGAGKATAPIATALESILGERISGGLVVLKHGYPAQLAHIEVVHGAHPLPDTHGHAGAQRMFDLVGTCTQKDLVIAAITGGSSALLPLPVAGVSLADKQRINELLLLSGADITQINAVRKHLSRIKGGWLAQRVLPATLVNLTVSDVIGDPLDYITDPTVADTSTFEDARDVLDEFDLWDKLPPAAAAYLREGGAEQETPKSFEGQPLHTFILVPGVVACQAAVQRSRELGFEPMLLTTMLKGEARDSGGFFAAIGREIAHSGQPMQPPCAIIAGGENTVTIKDGKRGMGGPNQEFALSAAREISGLPGLLVASLDTDGTDGPTHLAGGMVDHATLETAERLGINVDICLRDHDTLEALERLGDAVVTGHTGTNINDLKLLLAA
ncbi:MAG: glycerate kinase [Anaerolineae bacterium]|nr:glycerate kinase [Anaerolineae bacterium]